MKKAKCKNGLLKILIAVLVVVALGATGGWYFFGQTTTTEELPPSFEIEGSNFQGRSITDYGNFMKFDANDVTEFDLLEIPEGNLELSDDGVQYFYAAKDTTLKEMLTNIKPEEGMRMLAAAYTDSCYHVFPQGPFDKDKSCLLAEDELDTLVLKKNQGVALMADRQFEYNTDFIRNAKTLSSEFKVGLPYNKVDWVMHPASSNIDLTSPEIILVYKQIDNNKFVKVSDLANYNPAAEDYKMLWVKAEVELPALQFEMKPLVVEAFQVPLAADAYVANVKYLINDIATASHLADVPGGIDARYKSKFLLNYGSTDSGKNNQKLVNSYKEAFQDNRKTPYIVSAVEVEVKGGSGTVEIVDVSYSHTGLRRIRKYLTLWIHSGGWETQASSWCIEGASSKNLRLLSYQDGVLTDKIIIEDIDANFRFNSADKVDTAALQLKPGKHVLLIELTGLDKCASSSSKTAPTAVWTKHTVDFGTMSFKQPGQYNAVYFGAFGATTPVKATEITGKEDPRQFYLKDDSPKQTG